MTLGPFGEILPSRLNQLIEACLLLEPLECLGEAAHRLCGLIETSEE